MKNKKIRPLSAKASKKKSTNPTKLRQKWWFAIILIALLIGYLVWKNSLPAANTTAVESLPTTTEQTEAVPSTATSLDNVVKDGTLDDSQAIAAVTDTEAPDPETILNAPLPETDSLAKEEIDRLEDERKRLAEQEKLATEQITMTKQLTEMKAEQIELLEQQIAQLEADTNAKTSAK
ncbi:hypothetical protein [Psychrobacter sp. DAB_AL62B]|uniref:hypothetical protein n=1 Tax=Psychrobacter sp. DAB_AL62B TaxID=1028420 RepID=UPI002380C56D|nr:hypothetical protein [Psychrobacter sp. DAB_AL62B]MDE4454286.1 hypothetical protein [Psychrobacter sp. DAB_AL62B]